MRCARDDITDHTKPCQACIQAGIVCESTLPRRRRFYGSLEGLSIRYRALEALVNGLFPDLNLSDTQELFRVAEVHNIIMPDPNDISVESAAFNDLSKSKGTPVSRHVRQFPEDELERKDERIYSDKHLEERLIPAPHGVSHYVGPSSSFMFANTLRSLVAKKSGGNSVSDIQTWQNKRAADFASSMKTSKALEPRNPDHPAIVSGHDTEDHLTLTEENDHVPTSLFDAKGVLCSSSETASTTSKTRGHRLVQELLPPRDTADFLVDMFFDRVHPNLIIFQRQVFQMKYEALWRDPMTESLPEQGWICCIFMTFVFGSQVAQSKDTDDSAALQRKYLSLIRERFHHLGFSASLDKVQALMLLQLYHYNAGERNAAWMLLGQAMRMAIALGMHRKTKSNLDPIEQDISKMVWWSLFTAEQSLSLVLGRPCLIHQKEISVPLPTEEILDVEILPTQYAKYAVPLSLMFARVKDFVSRASLVFRCQDDLANLLGEAQNILDGLYKWFNTLPKHLRTEAEFAFPQQRRAVCLLHINYYHILSLIGRPYLLCKVNSSIESNRDMESSAALQHAMSSGVLSLAEGSINASLQVAELVQELWHHNLFEGVVWMDAYYLHHAMLVLSLEFLGYSFQDSQIQTSHLSRDPMKLENSRRKVRDLIHIAKCTPLAPTFQVLFEVALQFAHIAGSAQEECHMADDSRLHSHLPPFEFILPQFFLGTNSNTATLGQGFDDNAIQSQRFTDLYQYDLADLDFDILDNNLAPTRPDYRSQEMDKDNFDTVNLFPKFDQQFG